MKEEKVFKKLHYIFILLLILLLYIGYNYEPIQKRFDIIKETGQVFSKSATYTIFNLSTNASGIDMETHRIEEIIFEQTNIIREENNLEKLKWDPMLSNIARLHAIDMAKNSYLNHTDLEGNTATDRAIKAGIKTKIIVNNKVYEIIGENIGFMPKGIVEDKGVIVTHEDVAYAAFLDWMLSQRHKDNILFEDYLFIGVGVAKTAKDEYYLVQNFQ